MAMQDSNGLYLMAMVPTPAAEHFHAARDLSGLHIGIEDDRLHITILGLSGQDERQDAIVRAIGESSQAPFRVVFDRCVVTPERALLTHSEPLMGVRRCQALLGAALRRRGIRAARPDPHVTLSYRAGREGAVRRIEPISWQVKELILMRSLTGRHQHIPLARWPLKTPSLA